MQELVQCFRSHSVCTQATTLLLLTLCPEPIRQMSRMWIVHLCYSHYSHLKMSYSPFLPNGQWPLVCLQDTLFQYFLCTKYCTEYEELVSDSFDSFLKWFDCRATYMDGIHSSRQSTRMQSSLNSGHIFKNSILGRKTTSCL